MDDAGAVLVLVSEDVFRRADQGWMATAFRVSGPRIDFERLLEMEVVLTRADGGTIATRVIGVETCAPPKAGPDWAGVLLPVDTGPFLAVGAVLREVSAHPTE
jgi:hypothetical protein